MYAIYLESEMYVNIHQYFNYIVVHDWYILHFKLKDNTWKM